MTSLLIRRHSSFGKCLLTTLFMTLLISLRVFAADGLIYFSDPEAKAGETVEVTMTVQCDGTDISNANIILKYSADTLQFVSGTDASGGAGTVAVRGKGTVTSDGKNVYTLTFLTPVAGEYTVNIDTCDVTDASGASVNITHKGSSKITVAASDNADQDVQLSSLEISPGNLEPSFSPAVTQYSAIVGLSVDKLIINANASSDTCIVDVIGANELKDGENDVIVYVRSADGSKQTEYHILVTRAEGGVENITTAAGEETTIASVEGVQLSCKGKTITIMDPDASVKIPAGFRNSTIKIDGQPVQGWISEEDADPEYFLVYGMNDAGELNFYRYDRTEKTIQRYFDEKQEGVCLSSEEYESLQAELEAQTGSSSSRKLICWILGVVVFLLLCILIYLIVKLSSANKELEEKEEDEEEEIAETMPRRARRSTSGPDDLAKKIEQMTESIDMDPSGENELFSSTSGLSDTDDDGYTKVLPAGQRRRSSRKALNSGDTTVLRRNRERRNSLPSDDFEEF